MKDKERSTEESIIKCLNEAINENPKYVGKVKVKGLNMLLESKFDISFDSSIKDKVFMAEIHPILEKMLAKCSKENGL